MPNLPVLIAAAVPVIGRYLQSAAAEDRARAATRAAAREATLERRRSELESAKSILIDVSVRLNVLAFYVDEAMASCVFDRGGVQALIEEDRQTWDSYREKLIDWRQYAIIDRSNVSQYFGAEALELLRDIQERFLVLENQLKACHYHRRESRYYIEDNAGSPNDFRIKYYGVRLPLDDEIQQLSIIMIQRCRTSTLL